MNESYRSELKVHHILGDGTCNIRRFELQVKFPIVRSTYVFEIERLVYTKRELPGQV